MRNTLPQRRHCETFDLTFGSVTWRVTVGFYPENHHSVPGEVFVSDLKSGTDIESIARDGAILLSLAMQHGVPLETIKAAITRDGNSQPSSIIGAIVDRLAK